MVHDDLIELRAEEHIKNELIDIKKGKG